MLRRYQTGECTPAEEQVVEQWYESLGQHREVQQLTPAERQELGTALWQRIMLQTGLSTAEEAPAPPTRWQIWRAQPLRWAAAAAVLVGVGLGAARLASGPATVTDTAATATSDWTEYTNQTPHAVTLTLQDQSRVTLAPASSLKYPQHFTGPGRDVYLVGKGFFKVSHNPARPFQVHTQQLVTTVLGTTFTVDAFAGQKASVQVRTGKVRVTPLATAAEITAAAPASVVLRPNQQAVYTPDKAQLTKELVTQPAVLVEQNFAFEDRPVADVLTALETAYGVDIVYDKDAFAHCTVTLKLSSESLYEKLDVLCKTLGASYQKDGTRIHMLGRPCKPE
ncbi:hypothetical protein B0919_12935 [Hymenobacter sp. CRA2]|nr:hypothetical protein B0919_12935 [Hymenobacter sp. CRA2]